MQQREWEPVEAAMQFRKPVNPALDIGGTGSARTAPPGPSEQSAELTAEFANMLATLPDAEHTAAPAAGESPAAPRAATPVRAESCAPLPRTVQRFLAPEAAPVPVDTFPDLLDEPA